MVMQEFLVRLVQVHESFRVAELQALADLHGIPMEIAFYSEDSPFCIIRLPSESAARTLVRRSILSQGIYALWGSGATYDELHESVRRPTPHPWKPYASTPFRFTIDSYQSKRSSDSQRSIIESFSYMALTGPIIMSGADLTLTVFEFYPSPTTAQPTALYLGRFLASSDRIAKTTYDLKKRRYISTTSMDSELALVTANLAHAAPGKLFYDPFMGTGSFPLACAHFGAMVTGSDIDGRSIRGKPNRNVVSNFEQYGTKSLHLDSFISDLTNTPLRVGETGWLDGIVCDPPYGVREGLKVLGTKDGRAGEVVFIEGKPAHTYDTYIPPKKPYSFDAMQLDIVAFAAATLVPGSRLSMWMPTANDEDVELAIPSHPALKLVSVCVQPFNKWSRRLLTYQRLRDEEVDGQALRDWRTAVREARGKNADDLNHFRRKYFQGFHKHEQEAVVEK